MGDPVAVVALVFMLSIVVPYGIPDLDINCPASPAMLGCGFTIYVVP